MPLVLLAAACSGSAVSVEDNGGVDSGPGGDAGAEVEASTVAALDASVDAPTEAAPDAASVGAPFRIALSISPFSEILFANNLALTDGTKTATDNASLTALFAAHGASEVFARIATPKTKLPNTGSPDSSLARGLDRAKVAKDLGLAFNPELGLFRTYGDVSCQTQPALSDWGITLPGSWETLNADQMATALQAYTTKVATELVATGARIEVWDVGNEVDFGTAGVAPQPLPGACDAEEGHAGWYKAPNGVDAAIGAQSVYGLLTMDEPTRIAWLTAHLWPHEAKLFGAAAAGIRSVVPGARIATHISTSSSPTFAVAFYEAMKDGGATIDVAGFSYYPTATTAPDRLKSFRMTVEAVRGQLGMPVFLAELGYPAQPMTGTSYFSGWNNALPHYPLTETGQHDLFRDLASWGSSGALAGIRPWGPDLFVSDWSGMSLFRGNAGSPAPPRTSLDALAQGAAMPNPAALQE